MSAPTIAELERRLALMVDYLDLRRTERDWHGVQDAASDIREIEAKLSLSRQIVESVSASTPPA